MEAARLIKSKNSHSMVEVKDLKSGDVTAVAPQAGVSMPLKLRPSGLGSGIDKDLQRFHHLQWRLGPLRGIDAAALMELMEKFKDVEAVLYDQMWPDKAVTDVSHETVEG